MTSRSASAEAEKRVRWLKNLGTEGFASSFCILCDKKAPTFFGSGRLRHSLRRTRGAHHWVRPHRLRPYSMSRSRHSGSSITFRRDTGVRASSVEAKWHCAPSGEFVHRFMIPFYIIAGTPSRKCKAYFKKKPSKRINMRGDEPLLWSPHLWSVHPSSWARRTRNSLKTPSSR